MCKFTVTIVNLIHLKLFLCKWLTKTKISLCLSLSRRAKTKSLIFCWAVVRVSLQCVCVCVSIILAIFGVASLGILGDLDESVKYTRFAKDLVCAVWWDLGQRSCFGEMRWWQSSDSICLERSGCIFNSVTVLRDYCEHLYWLRRLGFSQIIR